MAAINSLCQALCLDLAIVDAGGSQLAIVSAAAARMWPPRRPAIKQEPIQDYLSVSGGPAGLVSIKRERVDSLAKSYIPTVQTATVATSSWLKCPSAGCKFHSSSVADMQAHIVGCAAATTKETSPQVGSWSSDLDSKSTTSSHPAASNSSEGSGPRGLSGATGPPAESDSSGMSQEVVSTPHVDIKLNPLAIKREQIKQEGVDPLERKVSTSPLKVDNIKKEADEEEDEMEDESLADQISIR